MSVLICCLLKSCDDMHQGWFAPEDYRRAGKDRGPNLFSLYSLADCAMQDYRLRKEANAYPRVRLGFGRRYECARLINALVGMREPSLS